jgi:hypothetical protein
MLELEIQFDLNHKRREDSSMPPPNELQDIHIVKLNVIVTSSRLSYVSGEKSLSRRVTKAAIRVKLVPHV